MKHLLIVAFTFIEICLAKEFLSKHDDFPQEVNLENKQQELKTGRKLLWQN